MTVCIYFGIELYEAMESVTSEYGCMNHLGFYIKCHGNEARLKIGGGNLRGVICQYLTHTRSMVTLLMESMMCILWQADSKSHL